MTRPQRPARTGMRWAAPASLAIPICLWTFFVFLLSFVPGTAGIHDPGPVLCCLRYGEAEHPGPQQLVSLGTSNPGGLRGKEPLINELGPGVWCLSETQLSSETQRTSQAALVHAARKQDRHVRVLHGAWSTRAFTSWFHMGGDLDRRLHHFRFRLQASGYAAAPWTS